MDASFASSVGPQTVYPAGFSLDAGAADLLARAELSAGRDGQRRAGRRDAGAGVDGPLPPRNASGGHGQLLRGRRLRADRARAISSTGVGVRQMVPGTGTITASGTAAAGRTPAALFNLQVNLFYPEIFAPDPVVKYDGQWWPAMSVSCAVTNTVTLDSAAASWRSRSTARRSIRASTTEIGAFSFFGVSVPVFCAGLAPASGRIPRRRGRFPAR